MLIHVLYRTTTKTQKMIEKFQSLYAMDGDPTCLIVLQVKGEL